MALPANASTLLAEFDAAEWAQLGETTHAAFAILSRRAEVARDRLFMPTFKEMVWPHAEVTVRREGGRGDLRERRLRLARLPRSGRASSELPDNFFDVLPRRPHGARLARRAGRAAGGAGGERVKNQPRISRIDTNYIDSNYINSYNS